MEDGVEYIILYEGEGWKQMRNHKKTLRGVIIINVSNDVNESVPTTSGMKGVDGP